MFVFLIVFWLIVFLNDYLLAIINKSTILMDLMKLLIKNGFNEFFYIIIITKRYGDFGSSTSSLNNLNYNMILLKRYSLLHFSLEFFKQNWSVKQSSIWEDSTLFKLWYYINEEKMGVCNTNEGMMKAWNHVPVLLCVQNWHVAREWEFWCTVKEMWCIALVGRSCQC